MENWKYHKPKVASYWLVKLDSMKRRKVSDAYKYIFTLDVDVAKGVLCILIVHLYSESFRACIYESFQHRGCRAVARGVKLGGASSQFADWWAWLWNVAFLSHTHTPC